MLGVHSVLENETADANEIIIERDAEAIPLDGGRYEIEGHIFQPMWGKENLIEPLDVVQVLFKK